MFLKPKQEIAKTELEDTVPVPCLSSYMYTLLTLGEENIENSMGLLASLGKAFQATFPDSQPLPAAPVEARLD